MTLKSNEIPPVDENGKLIYSEKIANSEDYVDSHLQDLRNRETSEIKEGLEYIKDKATKDHAIIEAYTDPYLKTLRKQEDQKAVAEHTEKIHQAFENISMPKDSSIGSKDASPSTENTIWSKQKATKKEPDEIDKEAAAILNTKVASKPSSGALSKVKNWTMALLGLGMTGQALATEGGKKEEPKKPTQEQTIDTKKARKIDKEPTDPQYKKIGTEGDKTFYAKKSSSGLEKAKPGSAKANPEEYMKQMIAEVKNGVSPKDLLKQGYITPEAAEELEQYVDIVYTQPETQKSKEIKKNPFAAYAEEGEVIYANTKAKATMHYQSRKSTNIEVGGGKNTSEEDVLFKFLDENGNFNGKYARVKKGEDLNKVLDGSKYFQGNSFEELSNNALSVNDTYELNGNEVASGATL